MAGDARFEDATDHPLALRAFDGEDLQVLSALVQDAIFNASDVSFSRKRRRFAVLVNRFRWEAGTAAPERVRSVLAVEDVLGVQTQGFGCDDCELVFSVLALDFRPGPDGAGEIEIILAGDGGIRLRVEALEATLKDVTRPYIAPTGKRPHHDLAG